RPGEVLALAGLEGSGAREVARSIAGFHPFDRGAVRLAGRRVRHLTPALAVAHGVAYVPEDRHAEGLALSLTVAENVSLAFLDRLRRWGVLLDRRAERRLAAQWIERLAVRPPEPDREVAQLSGGNQQKVLVAKWLAREPQVLVLDSPTVGVDVAAKAEIHDLVRKLAAQRTAVMLVSSDWTEVLDLADRILVMARGRMRAEFSAAEATEETLMAAAMGS
ncbi:MAG: sugar ABC transporter ATP-binding protein, partial [Acidobacteria bacterium]|nr:sugar ABC transporter ATP-binding protein [Acidobacteriota bacterium]